MRQLLIIGALLLTHVVMAQFTLTGLKGLIHVPTAAVIEEGTFLLGSQTNTGVYNLIDQTEYKNPGDEYVSVASIGFYKRFVITACLSRVIGAPKQKVGTVSSIGDRSIHLTYQILQEGKWLPDMAINLSDPFYSSTPYLVANHVVATKKILNSDTHRISVTAGYGFGYVIAFKNQNQRELQKKESNWLTGIFGGLQYTYLPLDLVASVEYDGWHVNAAVGKVFWERLSFKVFMQGLQYPGISLHYQGKIR